MIALQAETTSGKTIDGAVWEVKNYQSLSVGSSVWVFNDVEDERLVNYLTKFQKDYVRLVVEDVKKVKIEFFVKKVSYIMNKGELDCIVTISPVNREIDDVMWYLFKKENCNKWFLEQINKNV